MTGDQDDGLDPELLAALQGLAPGAPDLYAALERARQAPPPEPTIIPLPEVVFGAQVIARFRCPLGCGWRHEEPADVGPSRIILPIDFSLKELNEALTFESEVRELAMRTRVEAAITNHYREQHPDV